MLYSSPPWFLFLFQSRKIFGSTCVLTVLQLLKVVSIPLTSTVDKLLALAIMLIEIKPRDVSHTATRISVLITEIGPCFHIICINNGELGVQKALKYRNWNCGFSLLFLLGFETQTLAVEFRLRILAPWYGFNKNFKRETGEVLGEK